MAGDAWVARRHGCMYGAGGLPHDAAAAGSSWVEGMNRFERLFGLKGEARVSYLHGEFRVDQPGDFVICAVTGKQITLTDLRYWNVELQEPYSSAEASLERHAQLRRQSSALSLSGSGRK